MTVTSKVVLDGKTLTEGTIVAVYYNDQIRGKIAADVENYVYLTVGGDAEDRDIPLHFKVYTGGRIIEVDQGLKFSWQGKTGSYADPYIITLPTPVTTNTSSEGWATTCLPFNAAVPEGVTVFAATTIEGGALKIQKVEGCTILPKETPVLLKTDAQTSYEWLARVANGDAVIETNLFKGTTEATAVAAGSVLTLGHATDGNKAIGFWRFTGTSVPANRAYLEASVTTNVRGVTIDWNDMATGIGEVRSGCEVRSEKCEVRSEAYDLSGRKILHSSLPHPSLVIVNGKKIVLR